MIYNRQVVSCRICNNLKGENLIMKKVIKKVATVAAAVSMAAAMSVSAFAADFYQFVGNPNLFGDADQGNDKIGWVTTLDTQNFTAVDGQDDLYSFTSTYALPSDQTPNEDPKKDPMELSRQFKVLADGQEFAWNYQMCLGIPESAWADNQSQFKVVGDLQPAEYKVYMNPTKGFVCLIQDKKNVELNVRYHSKDEESWNFVALSKKAIVGDGYEESTVYFDDKAYLEFVNQCLELEGGEKITALAGGSSDDAKVSDDKKETKADEKTTEAKKDNKDDKKDSNNTMPIVLVVVAVVVIAVIAVVVSKSKKSN